MYRSVDPRALREENSLDLFFLALQGREEREFLEGKLDAHLKNVEPPSINRGIGPVLGYGVYVIQHHPHGRIEIPIQAGGEIAPFPSLDPPVTQIQDRISHGHFPAPPIPFSGGEIFLRPDPVKNPVLPVIGPVLAGQKVASLNIPSPEDGIPRFTGMDESSEIFGLER